MLPPLRNRKEDIKELTDFFLNKISNDLEIHRPQLSSEVVKALVSHSWPGNIRELKNVLERSLVFNQPDVLQPDHISFDHDLNPIDMNAYQQSMESSTPVVASPTGHPQPTLANNQDSNGAWVLPQDGIELEVLEKNLLVQALERARNNQTKAAALLGISRHTFRYRLEKYGISNH